MPLPFVSFTVPGRLGGKQRPRAFVRQGRIALATPKQTENAEALVAQLAAVARRDQGIAQFAGPVMLDITVFRHTPKSWPRKRAAAARWITGKPDADNTAKLVCDAVNHSGVWQDDAQVACLHVKRIYDNEGEERVAIIIAGLEEAA